MSGPISGAAGAQRLEQHMTNIDTVHAVYEAFGRGDITAIMNVLADDIDWDYAITDAGVPWLRPRTGHAGALDFFPCRFHSRSGRWTSPVRQGRQGRPAAHQSSSDGPFRTMSYLDIVCRMWA